MKRELWETVTDLITGLVAPEASRAGLYVTDMTVDLPVELAVVQTEVGFQLLIDAPHHRWDAGLRPKTSRLQLTLRRLETEEAELLAKLVT